MEAAQDELKLFTEVMKCVHKARESDPSLKINVVELNDHFLFTGINGTHMCFVYEQLGGSLLDLIKHYNCGDLNAVIFNHDTSQVRLLSPGPGSFQGARITKASRKVFIRHLLCARCSW